MERQFDSSNKYELGWGTTIEDDTNNRTESNIKNIELTAEDENKFKNDDKTIV